MELRDQTHQVKKYGGNVVRVMNGKQLLMIEKRDMAVHIVLITKC